MLTKTKRLTQNQRAVAVAKDVLKRMRFLNLRPGYYLGGRVPKVISDPQKQIAVLEKNCDVCALGAAVLSKIRLYNKVHASEILLDDSHEADSSYICVDQTKIYDIISDVFDEQTATLVEYAFERRNWYGSFSVDQKLKDKAKAFGAKYTTNKPRLAAIMRNIIHNKGKFVP